MFIPIETECEKTQVSKMSINTPIPPAFVSLFDEALLKNELPGEHKSVIEQLLDQLEAHERDEDSVLGDYERAATGIPDAGVRFLMGLVLEDEKRHHQLSQAMSRDVRQSLLWLHDQPALPEIAVAGQARPALREQTARFLE